MARTRSVVPSTVLGSLFRLSTWLYLRLVPLHWAAKYILPTLLVSYFAALLSPWERAQLAPAPLQPTEPVGSIEPAYTDVKTEGAEDEETESKPVVPVKQPLVVVPSEPKLTPLNIARTVLFSLPTPSKPLALASVAINTLLFLFCLDFAYSPDFKSYDPTFSRVGAVDSSSAKILIRYPHLDEHQLRIVYRHVSPALFEVGWKDGPVIDIEEEKDFTAAAKLTGLWPSSKYEYKLAYLNSTLLPYPAEPIAFKTFPDPRMSSGVHFRFLASSCVLINYPYSPLGHETIKGWDLLHNYVWPPTPYVVEVAQNASTAAAHAYQTVSSAVSSEASVVTEALHSASTVASSSLSSASSVASSVVSSASSVASSAVSSASSAASSAISSASSSFFVKAAKPLQLVPEFMLFMGDLIYADRPTWGGDNLEYYRKEYRRVYSSLSFRKVYEKLPIFMAWDDHEFVNNFAGEGTDRKIPFRNASSAWDLYNGQANPDPIHSDTQYYDFRYGDNAFFVMDTRRYRSKHPLAKKSRIAGAHLPGLEDEDEVVDESLPPKPLTMLGDQQLTALYSWLGKVNQTSTFKFIVSSVPFTSLWRGVDGHLESWAGYTEERDAILDVLEYVPNVVIISGDRHEFAVVEFRGKVLEVSVSPLSQFALSSYSMKDFSDKLIEKSVTTHEVDSNGTTYTVEAIEYVPEEMRLKYIAAGVYKFGTFEVDTTDRSAPTLKIEAIISGQPVYELLVKGKPVAFSFSKAIGHQLTAGLKGVLDKLGLNPLKWL